MLASLVNFTNDAAGLEKTLRLLQSLCTIAIGLYGPEAIRTGEPELLDPWVTARSQFMLGRRYFRLLKWHPCWSAAYSAAMQEHAETTGMLRKTIEVLKWTFLGAYFFLEMFVITNMMGVTKFAWGPRMQLEANKCWFYAIVTSIVLSVYDLLALWLSGTVESTSRTQNELKSEKLSNETTASQTAESTHLRKTAEEFRSAAAKQARSDKLQLYTQLAIDGCDIFIPGSAIGWLPVNGVMVGTCGTISTLLAGQQIWVRVQARQ